MKLIFRLLWLILTQSRRSRVEILDAVDTSFRVFPNDLDVFLHVNNGVYFAYADLGRTDLMLRSGTFHKIRQRGWYPVIASETIQFKKSLTLGQRFTIRTQIIGWNSKAIYIEQIFTHGDSLVARSLIDTRFLSKSGGKVSTDELMALLGLDLRSPDLPKKVQQWIASGK